MKLVFFLSILFAGVSMFAQDSDLPYREIPDPPGQYNEGNVMSRLVDGLGFRYYWATQGLTEKDLEFKHSPEARTIEETIDHIFNLAFIVLNAANSAPNDFPDISQWSFQKKREETLMNITKASELLKSGKPGEMENYQVLLEGADGPIEFPFWNIINGPLSDAIFHTGQVVSLRRASGNPIYQKISFMRGKVYE